MFGFSTFAETPFAALSKAIVDGQVAIDAVGEVTVSGQRIHLALVPIDASGTMVVTSIFKWDNIPDGTEIWNAAADSATTWTPIADGSEIWTSAAPAIGTWTIVPAGSETWTRVQ